MKLIVLMLAVSFGHNADTQNVNGFDITQLSWLEGNWEGEGLGGLNYESWSTSIDGTMMGMFRHTKNNKVVFYEFCKISSQGLQLKHFNPDLSGWEEKEEIITFPFISMSTNTIVFDGLRMELVAEDELKVIVQLQHGETTFTYKKL